MQTTYPSRTIADVFVHRTAVNTIILMIGFALLTALAAQIRFHIPGTPVPVTGQTFAVLLAGATLGSRTGAGSQLIYWLMGAIGLPVLAQANGGWEAAAGATFGYLFGFIVGYGSSVHSLSAVGIDPCGPLCRHSWLGISSSTPSVFRGSCTRFLRSIR